VISSNDVKVIITYSAGKKELIDFFNDIRKHLGGEEEEEEEEGRTFSEWISFFIVTVIDPVSTLENDQPPSPPPLPPVEPPSPERRNATMSFFWKSIWVFLVC